MPSHKAKQRLDKARRIIEHHGCLLLDQKVGLLKKDPVRILCICTRVFKQVPYLFSQRPYCKDCRRRVSVKEVRSFGRLCRRVLHKIRTGDKQAAEAMGYGLADLEAMFATLPGKPRIRSGKYNFDHVRPLSVLARLGLRDPKIANGLDNLMPMTPKENSDKGARCDPVEVVAWLKSKGFVLEVVDGDHARKVQDAGGGPGAPPPPHRFQLP